MNKYEIELAGRTLSIETGSLAKQANGSVVVRYGDTVVLVTAVAGPAKDGIDFMPLTVDFEERLYAVGRIPGSFFPQRGKTNHRGDFGSSSHRPNNTPSVPKRYS